MRQALIFAALAFGVAGCASSQGSSTIPPAAVANAAQLGNSATSVQTGQVTQCKAFRGRSHALVACERAKDVYLRDTWNLEVYVITRPEPACWTSDRDPLSYVPAFSTQHFRLKQSGCTQGFTMLVDASVYLEYACVFTVSPDFKVTVSNYSDAHCFVRQDPPTLVYNLSPKH